MSINTWSIGDFFIGDSSDLMDNEKVIQQFGDVIVYFWKNRVKELFPKKEIIGDFMNYNSLVFRKDMTGVVEYVKWSGITADLMRAYLYSQRSIINGVSYICYDGELLPEKDVLDAFNRFFGISELVLVEGVSDVQLISYYLQNVYGWKHERDNRLGIEPLDEHEHIESLSKIDWSKSASLNQLFLPFQHLGEDKPSEN